MRVGPKIKKKFKKVENRRKSNFFSKNGTDMRFLV